MDTSIPATGKSGGYTFIASMQATGATPAGTGAPVLSTAPSRSARVLTEGPHAGNAGWQIPPPMIRPPHLISTADSGMPQCKTPENARREANIPDSIAGQWAVGLGISLENHGMHNQALPYFLYGLPFEEKALGTDDPTIIYLYRHVGTKLAHQGQYAQATAYFLKVLSVEEKRLGADDPALAALYKCIGSALQHQCKHAEAVDYFRKALSIEKSCCCADDAVLSGTCRTIGLVLQLQCKYEEAMQYFREALSIAEKRPGETCAYGLLHQDIGLLLAAQGEHEQAVDWLRKGLAIEEKAHSTDHGLTALYHDNIASVLGVQGKDEEAMEHAGKVSSILARTQYNAGKPDGVTIVQFDGAVIPAMKKST